MSTEIQSNPTSWQNAATQAAQPLATPIVEQADTRRWLALIVLLFAGFMDLLDVSIVNIAIPSIQRDLAAPYSTIQWIIAGYSLAFALTLITGGRLGDIFGRKRVFMIGVTGFTLASLMCGLSANPEVLVAARVVQGAMAAIMTPQVLSIIQVTFPRRERAKAFGMYGAVAGLAAVAGPLLGGFLIEGNLFGLDWRPIFLINIPVGILALIISGAVVRESRSPQAIKLDLVGMLLVTGGLLLLVDPLVQGRDLDWPAWIFISMAASIPVLALFVFYERHKTRLDGSPLVALSLFRERSFVVGLLTAIIFFAGMSSFFMVYTLYVQIGLGWSAIHAALTGLPASIGAIVFSGASIALAPKIGRKVIIAGVLLMAAGMVLMIFTIQLAGTDITSWHLIPSMLIGGTGMGLVIAPIADIVLAGVPLENAGSASGVVSTINQLGGAIGVAVIGVIFFGHPGHPGHSQRRRGSPSDQERPPVGGCALHRSGPDSARLQPLLPRPHGPEGPLRGARKLPGFRVRSVISGNTSPGSPADSGRANTRRHRSNPTNLLGLHAADPLVRGGPLRADLLPGLPPAQEGPPLRTLRRAGSSIVK